jgi:hypothetical protein
MKGIPDNADLDTLFGFMPGQGSPFDYVPTWMKVPNIHPTNGNPIAVIKLFHPASGWEWYITEVDRRTHEAFGLVVGDVVEMGYFSLLEIAQIGPIRVERDLYFHPTPLEEIRRAKAHPHRQEDTVQLPEMYIAFRSHSENQEEEDREEENPEPQETSKVTVPNVQQEEHPQELHGEESVVIPPLPAMHVLFRRDGVWWAGDTAHFDAREINRALAYMVGLADQLREMGWEVTAMSKTFGNDSLVIFLGGHPLFGKFKEVQMVITNPPGLPELARAAYANPPIVVTVDTPAPQVLQMDEYIRSVLRLARSCVGDDPEAILNKFDEIVSGSGISSEMLWAPERFLEQIGIDPGIIERWLKAKYSEAGKPKRRREAQANGQAEEAQAEASPRRRRREAASAQAAEEPQSKSTKQKATRYQAGDITLERGQPIQVMIGWRWREATVHAVSGRNLIYQVEGGRRGKTPVAGREITWRLA